VALLLKTHGITRVRPLQGGAEAWLDLLARDGAMLGDLAAEP